MAAAPRLAARLLRIFLSREDVEVVIGDLDELFLVDRVPRDGVRAARRWYWRQVASVIAASPVNRLHRRPELQFRRSKGAVMAAIGQDLSYALRGLRKQPGFAATAVLTLALGIGVNIAIFSIAHAVLFKPLPFADPDRLMVVQLLSPVRDAPGTFNPAPWSYPKYQLLREQQTVFDSTAIFSPRDWNLTGTGEPERVTGEFVEWSYFRTLGIAPHVGRVFTADETRAPGTPPLAILSHGLWTRRFGGDAGVIGRTIGLGGIPHTIVGVLPAGFRGLSGQAEIWLPVMMLPAGELGEPQSHSYFLVARRKAFIEPDEAAAAVQVLGARIHAQYGAPFAGDAPWSARALPLDDQRVDPLIRRSVLILLASVAAVLLIACVNLANLTLVRALARQRDVAIRLALGAGRIRIVRQLMAESVLIASVGAICGLAVAYGAILGTAALMPDLRTAGPSAVLRGQNAGLTRVGLGMLGVDSGLALFTVAVTAASALAFGLIPAWRTSRSDVTMAMKAGSPGAIATGGRGFSLRNMLIAAEMALALLLLVAAGLMLKSVSRLQATELGFNPDRLLTFRVSFPGTQYTPQQGADAIQSLLERLEQRGEIDTVAYSFCAPVSGGCNGTFAERKDRPPAPRGSQPLVGVHWVSVKYFDTLGVRLIRGRLFTERDREGQPKVLLVNEAAARRIWGEEDPVGKRLSVGQGGYRDGGEVIGVVSNVRYGAVETAIGPDVYLPLLQSPRGFGVIFITSQAPASTLVPIIRSVLHAIDPDVPLIDIKTMDERFGAAIWRTRLSAWLLGAFSLLALILAAVGMYGVMAQATEQRTREIGVRMALGARRSDILRLVIGRASLICIAGVSLGIALSLPSTRLLATLLYEVKPGDPGVLAMLAIVLMAVAVLASYVPARRAMRVDPLVTLRAE